MGEFEEVRKSLTGNLRSLLMGKSGKGERGRALLAEMDKTRGLKPGELSTSRSRQTTRGDRPVALVTKLYMRHLILGSKLTKL